MTRAPMNSARVLAATSTGSEGDERKAHTMAISHAQMDSDARSLQMADVREPGGEGKLLRGESQGQRYRSRSSGK